MPELGPYGSVRGAAGNSRPYRERRDDETIAGTCGRRPKSAKARNRGRCGHRQCSGRYGDLARGVSVGKSVSRRWRWRSLARLWASCWRERAIALRGQDSVRCDAGTLIGERGRVPAESRPGRRASVRCGRGDGIMRCRS